jgi:hypothetical protein
VLAAGEQAEAQRREVRGLLTVMTLPSKALSESAAEFARMQVG